MNKITSIKIKYTDGSYSGQIPISVLAKNISWDDDGHDITDAIGDVDINVTGSLQNQINKKINTTDLSDYVNSQLAGDVADWLDENIKPINETVVIDKTVSIPKTAADAQSVREIFSTKEELKTISSELFHEIKWQIPQGAGTTYPYSISGNKITINGRLSASILRIFVYAKLGSTSVNPVYDKTYQKYYSDPISNFIPGHEMKANIKLISGTYQTDEKYDEQNWPPYVDLRDVNNNQAGYFLSISNNYINKIPFQPQMIAICFRAGNYNNAVFEFNIIDTELLQPAYIKLQSLKNSYLKNNENIIFDVQGSRYISYDTSNLTGKWNINLFYNIFSIDGTMTRLEVENPSSIIYFLISSTSKNVSQFPIYTSSTPNKTNLSQAYDGIGIEKFKIGHKYLFGIKLLSGSFTLQATDTSNNEASNLFLQLRDEKASAIYSTPNLIPNINSTQFFGEWVCNKIPECVLLGMRVGTYNDAVFQIIIKDITAAIENIPLEIKKNGLINISKTGMWLQGTYATNDGFFSNSNFDKRIHWCGLLPKKTKYIQFESTYQVALYGWDNDYNVQGWLNSWEINTDIFWQQNINDKQEKYFINIDRIKQYFPNVKYISIAARLKTNEIIDQTHGPNIKIYIEPDTVPFIDQYILTEEDFSIGYFSPTYKKNIYNTNTSRNYLTTGKFKVYAGDEIEGILDPESNLGFFVLFLESDLQENNGVIRSNSGYKYNNNFKCYCYEDGYCEISVLGDGTPLFPNLLGNNQIIIHRNKNNNFEKMNLLIQSRFYYERENKANGSFVNPQPLTLIHFSDNHGSLITLDKIQELLENQDYVKNVTTGSDYRKMFIIDDVLNTGDAVYTYYGYSVDGQTITDFYDESVSYVVNDYIVYNSILYQCITNTTGPFNTEHWSEISTTLQNQRLLSRKQYLDHQMGKKSLFVLGNHDTQLGDYNTNTQQTTTTNMWHALKREDAYNTFFAEQKDQWGVTQTLNRCYWYKDYQQAKIRLIGIDMAYWDAEEFSWLSNLLSQARTNGYSVVLASHSQLSKATGNQNVTFQDLATDVNSPGKYRNSGNWSYGTYPDFWENASGTINHKAENEEIMTLLQDYSDVIICHLHGHWHIDMFEYYDLAPDILTIGVDQGGASRAVHSAERTQSLPNWYVFNVITFDTYNKLIKIVRFGNDIDHYLRSKKVLTYDYANKRVITNY